MVVHNSGYCADGVFRVQFTQRLEKDGVFGVQFTQTLEKDGVFGYQFQKNTK